MKILFVLTSHDKLGDTGKKTGFWVEEFANPYYTLLDKGADITIATPKGGAAPIDPSSDSPDVATEDTERFNNDADAKERIAKTKVLADMNANDFDAVFYPGGHGPLWDLANDETSIALILIQVVIHQMLPQKTQNVLIMMLMQRSALQTQRYWQT